MMKSFLAGALALMGTTAMAGDIGLSTATSDDNFLAVLRNGFQTYADSNGQAVQMKDAKNEVAAQLDQIKNLIALGMSAIVVNAVDRWATQAVTDATAAANIPLVYLKREPINANARPDNQAFVASNEMVWGTLETKDVCRLLKEAGKTKASICLPMGELSNEAAVTRTKGVHDVIGGEDCGVKILISDEQTANWSRVQAQSLMTNWLSTCPAFDLPPGSSLGLM